MRDIHPPIAQMKFDGATVIDLGHQISTGESQIKQAWSKSPSLNIPKSVPEIPQLKIKEIMI
jgi:hypothetical protein